MKKTKKEVVLGLHGGHDAGVALVKDNQIIYAINEERLNRIKNYWGLPVLSLGEAMLFSQCNNLIISKVAINGLMQPTKEDMVENESNNLKNKLFTKIITSFVGKFLISTNFGVKSLVNILHILDRKRYRDYNELMQQHGLTDVSVSYFDHHLCHAASAYYCSGWNDSIIVTIDGSGDGYCSKVFVGNDGQLDEIKSIPMYHSPAYYYSYVTKLLGFKPMRHEGKITGLSAYGNDVDISNVLNSRISYDYKKSSFINNGFIYEQEIQFLKKLLEKSSKENISFGVQDNTEKIVCEYIEDILKKFEMPMKVCLAGGLFANVKLNQKIFELKSVDEIFVFPNMGDGGCSVGAAYLLDNQDKVNKPSEISTIYLGKFNNKNDIEKVMNTYLPDIEKSKNIEQVVAEKLSLGQIVARYNGDMEFGPRALGNRSILYSCRDKKVNQWLNKKLNRTEFMPFAPVVLEKYAKEYFINYESKRNKAAKYMTMTYFVTDLCKEKAPAVVHIDGTARPQVIDSSLNNSMTKILENYYSITGTPILVNTSFNMHEEPIINTPLEAVKSFKISGLDYLALGDYMISAENVVKLSV